MSHDDKRGFQHKIIIYDTSLNTGPPIKPKNPVQSVHDYTRLSMKLRSMASNDLHLLRKLFRFILPKN